MEKQLKLKEILLASAEENKKEEVEFVVKQSQLQLESDILATEKSIMEKKKMRNNILRGEFDSQKIIECDIEIEAYQDGLKRLNQLKTELF